MKISVVTPSVRKDGLDIVKRCLNRQTFNDFEWIVVSPFNYAHSDVWIKDPPKGDYFYALNRAWNEAFRQARGDLIVIVLDLLWFPPDTLEKLWVHYEGNPKSCVTCVGNQYNKLENNKPEHMVWQDPRKRTDFGSFYEVSPREMEFCLISIPREGIYAVGGIDEEFDRYAALSEKELCYRMELLGYKFYIDQATEYRAIKHPRLTDNWDEKYLQGCEYFDKCIKDIAAGKRCRLPFIGGTWQEKGSQLYKE